MIYIKYFICFPISGSVDSSVDRISHWFIAMANGLVEEFRATRCEDAEARGFGSRFADNCRYDKSQKPENAKLHPMERRAAEKEGDSEETGETRHLLEGHNGQDYSGEYETDDA